jgi:hypothetical protein
MFCAPELVFGGTEGVSSRFHVLRACTRFQRYRGRRVPFSYFALSKSFSEVPRALGSRFLFLRSGHVFVNTEGLVSRFPVLRPRTRFRRYRGRRVPFSCLAIPDTFSAVRRASGPVFMLCAPRFFFDGNEGVVSRFHGLRSRTHFWWYRGRQVPFLCFARPHLFSLMPMVSGRVFMFCAPELIFGGTEGVASCFHVIRSRTCFWRYLVRRLPFSCVAHPNKFLALPRASAPVFMCRPNSFLAVPRASAPVFMFCAPILVFGGSEGVGSTFHVLRSRTHFRRCGGRRVPFSCFAFPDSFSTVTRVFGGTEGVGTLFHILRSQIRFRRYRGRQVPFSCFARPDSFSAYRGRRVPFSYVCVPVQVSGGTEGVGSRFHVLRSRTRFR